ncbi:hypothetical protein FACS1894151_00230 [Spirochaetia bacterium]|nr:hypothetical protein FACS1894151_00230 [Spirochaetia bacterium]
MSIMTNFLKTLFRAVTGKYARLLYLIIFCIFVGYQVKSAPEVRRTFVFYKVEGRSEVIEERMIAKSGSDEADISIYVQEALLGPALPDTAPLLSRETKLLSLLLRDAVVYADFSAEASLAPVEGGDLFQNMLTLNQGIRRNFPSVKDVHFFISGNEIYPEAFAALFDSPSGL